MAHRSQRLHSLQPQDLRGPGAVVFYVLGYYGPKAAPRAGARPHAAPGSGVWCARSHRPAAQSAAQVTSCAPRCVCVSLPCATPSTGVARARNSNTSACHGIGRRSSTASSARRRKLSGSRSILMVGKTHLPRTSEVWRDNARVEEEQKRNEKIFRAFEVLF
jgi:hypothetical protein